MFTRLSLFVLVSSLFFGISANGVELNVAYETNTQPPYYMGNGKKIPAERPGVSVEMVSMLEKKIKDLKINFIRMPWKRCKAELKAGNIDAIFNSSYKTERLELGYYPTTDKTHKGPVDASRRITTLSYSLYVHKDTDVNWNGKNFVNVKGKIGTPFGFSIVDKLKKHGITVEEARSTDINFNKLTVNRLDGVAAQDVTGDALLKAFPEKYSSIVKRIPRLVTKPYYLMLSSQFVKKHSKLANQIWTAIKDIRENEFAEIAEKYKEDGS